jgi:hypothetical protein
MEMDTNKQFTVKSVCLELIKVDSGPSFKVISKFLRKLYVVSCTGVLLTKDNMLRRN